MRTPDWLAKQGCSVVSGNELDARIDRGESPISVASTPLLTIPDGFYVTGPKDANFMRMAAILCRSEVPEECDALGPEVAAVMQSLMSSGAVSSVVTSVSPGSWTRRKDADPPDPAQADRRALNGVISLVTDMVESGYEAPDVVAQREFHLVGDYQKKGELPFWARHMDVPGDKKPDGLVAWRIPQACIEQIALAARPAESSSRHERQR